jgi:type IV pilus assembly protein PilN
LINLLPHREAARQRRKLAFWISLVFSAAVALALALLWYGVLAQMLATQQERNQFLRDETAKLEAQIKDIANLRAEIDALRARQKAIEDLQLDRNLPVHVLNELVKQTPDGMYFTSVKQDGGRLLISGYAQSNERVTEFLRNTGNQSEWLSKPDLVEIKAANVGSSREQRRLYDFQVRVDVKRPQDPGAAASAQAASSPAKKS